MSSAEFKKKRILYITLLSCFLSGCVTNQSFQLPESLGALLGGGLQQEQEKEPAPVPAHVVADIGITECDRQAAYDTDLVQGVPFDDLDARAVISACEQALAEYPEHRRLQTLLARGYIKAGRYEDALTVASKASENGSGYADYQLGVIYNQYEKNSDKVIEYYEKASNEGVLSAMMELGWTLYFRDGWGDRRKAELWLQKAANSGYADFQQSLASFYFMMGVKDGIQDSDYHTEKAYPWYERAADKNQKNALFMIGRYYLFGFSPLPRNPDMALIYFERAYQEGQKDAAFEIAKLYLLSRENGGLGRSGGMFDGELMKKAIPWLLRDMPKLSASF